MVGLGTYKVFNVHGDAADARCEAVVDAALAADANLFDSSPMYGEAERVLAQALRGRRDEAIVATKVWARGRDIGEGQIEAALGWYGHVDVYQVHNLLSTEEHLPFLRRHKEAGLIKSLGATHYLTSAIPDLIELMKGGEIDSVQVPYHPLERTVERELLPEAERLGIGVIVMEPLDTGKLLARAPGPDELAPLLDYGVHTWPQAILKWIASDPRVSTVIPATSSPDHMRENAAAGSPPWFDAATRDYVRSLAE